MKEQADRRLKVARRLLVQGNLQKMLEILEEILFVDPVNFDDCELLRELKRAGKWAGTLAQVKRYLDAGNQYEAEKLAREVHEKDKTNQQALWILEQLSVGDAERIEASVFVEDFDARVDCLIQLCSTTAEVQGCLKRRHFKKADKAVEPLLDRSLNDSRLREPLARLKEEIEEQRKIWWLTDRPLLQFAKAAYKSGELHDALAALEKMSTKMSAARALRRKIENALQGKEQERKVKLAAAATEIRKFLNEGRLEIAREGLDRAARELGESHELNLLEGDLEEALKGRRDRQYFQLAKKAFERRDLEGTLVELTKMATENNAARDLKREVEGIRQEEKKKEREAELKATAIEIRDLLNRDLLKEAEEMLDRVKHELGENQCLEWLTSDFEKARQRRAEADSREEECKKSIKIIDELLKKRWFEEARNTLDKEEKRSGKENADLKRLRKQLPQCQLYYKETDREGREVPENEGRVPNKGPRYVKLYLKNLSSHRVILKWIQFLENGMEVETIDRDIFVKEKEERLLRTSTLRIRWTQVSDSTVSATVLLESGEPLLAGERLLISGVMKPFDD